MRYVNRTLTTAFDRMYLCLSKEKTCGKLLDRDLFDGQEFTIDKFCEECRQYFNKPWDFYSTHFAPNFSNAVASQAMNRLAG